MRLLHHLLLVALASAIFAPPGPARAIVIDIPVLVPLTGFLALEGSSQRNGALLALRAPPPGVTPQFDVIDTGTSPEAAVNALERALSDAHPIAAVGPILGTQMLALLPVALEANLPLLTVSGTADITRRGNPYVFRFFPGDAVVKAAQVRYAVETYHPKHPAVLYQTTAYGQSGRAEIDRELAASGIAPAYEDGLDVSVRNMQPAIAKALAAGADILLLHLHGVPTALFMKAAVAMQVHLPIVSGSALAAPATLALLEPHDIAGACAESGSSPMSMETQPMRDFVGRYQAAFHADPDAYALGQYDAMTMLLEAVARGAETPDAVTKALSGTAFDGLAMHYASDGHGDMAHSAVIVCFDGSSRTPHIASRFDFPATP